MRSSVLLNASFERTCDVLFTAATHVRIDRALGVSESIILGMPTPLRTGLVKTVAVCGDGRRDDVLRGRPPRQTLVERVCAVAKARPAARGANDRSVRARTRGPRTRVAT